MRLKVISFMLVMALMTMAIVLLPVGSEAESPWATVKVEYAGTYSGTIKGDEIQNVMGEGTMEFPIQGEIIHVIMTKGGEDYHEMTVSIMVDGNTRMSESTNEPMGEVRMAYSLGAEGDFLNDDSDDGGGGCVSFLSGSILLVLAGIMILARIRKRS